MRVTISSATSRPFRFDREVYRIFRSDAIVRIVRRGGLGLGGHPVGLGQNRSHVLHNNLVRSIRFWYEKSIEPPCDKPPAVRIEIITIIRRVSSCTVAVVLIFVQILLPAATDEAWHEGRFNHPIN